MASLKGYEPGASDSSDGLGACSATLGKEFAEAVRAIRLVIPRGESLSSQGLLTMSTGEAFTMPRVVTIGDATLSDHLIALDALCGELVLITLGAVDVMLLWDEGLGANGIVAGATNKTLLMPLSGLVLHFLHACSKDIIASIAPSGELSIVAGSTINSVRLGPKLLVDK